MAMNEGWTQHTQSESDLAESMARKTLNIPDLKEGITMQCSDASTFELDAGKK